MEKIENVLVVKVGTWTLANKDQSGRETLDLTSFNRIGQQIVDLSKVGIKPVVVTSAGITAGMSQTELCSRPKKTDQMPELQRLAAIGWPRLLHVWDIYTRNLTIGGLQLTRQELSGDSPEGNEALKTIHTMLKHDDLPLINENDAITTEEISFGDNDILAANLAVAMKRAETMFGLLGVVMLSTAAGVTDGKKTIKTVNDIAEVSHLVDDSQSGVSSGGMTSKLQAAGQLTVAGVNMWIAGGREENSIARAMRGEIGTHFVAKAH